MTPQVGDTVWIPCEVKPGPFSNERLARVQFPTGQWHGFVDVGVLKEDVEAGPTFVLAYVSAVHGDLVVAIVQGHAIEARHVQAPLDKVRALDSVSA